MISTYLVKCKLCNNETKRKIHNQLFCNPVCRNKYFYGNYFEKKKCFFCEKEFMSSKYHKAKYCSLKCYGVYQQWKSVISLGSPITAKCFIKENL